MTCPRCLSTASQLTTIYALLDMLMNEYDGEGEWDDDDEDPCAPCDCRTEAGDNTACRSCYPEGDGT